MASGNDSGRRDEATKAFDELNLKAKTKKEVGKFSEEHGIHGISEYFDERLDDFMDSCASVNIGIIGQTSSGKSTLINTLRGVRKGDPGAAIYGSKESDKTTKPTPYSFPMVKNVRLWDLPGHGTSDFKTANYWKQLHLDEYDSFIFLWTGRLQDADIKNVEKIHLQKKIVYFLRNKIDQEEDEWIEANTPETEYLADLRIQIKETLSKHLSDLSTVRIYLISARSKYVKRWDYKTFVEDLMLSPLEEVKKRAMIFAMVSCSVDIISAKTTEFRKNINKLRLKAEKHFDMNKTDRKANLFVDDMMSEASNYRIHFGVTVEEQRVVRESMDKNLRGIAENLDKLGQKKPSKSNIEDFLEEFDKAEKLLYDTLYWCEKLATVVLDGKLRSEKFE